MMVRRQLVMWVCSVVLAACAGPNDARVEPIIALTGDATNGRALYVSKKCNDCHGENGRGGFGVDLGSEDVHGTDKDELANTILVGYWFMPAFRSKLTDQEVADLLAYLDTVGR